MSPTFKDQLKDLTKQHPDLAPKKKKRHQKSQKRKSERLTESDIKSLMGMNHSTMRRGKGGAWRNGR